MKFRDGRKSWGFRSPIRQYSIGASGKKVATYIAEKNFIKPQVLFVTDSNGRNLVLPRVRKIIFIKIYFIDLFTISRYLTSGCRVFWKVTGWFWKGTRKNGKVYWLQKVQNKRYRKIVLALNYQNSEILKCRLKLHQS